MYSWERTGKTLIQMMTAIHVTMRSLKRRAEEVGQYLYMDNFISFPGLSDDFHTRGINCCGTVRQNRKGMPRGFVKTLKLKQGDIHARLRGNMTAMVWKDK
jgi:hypothetical protein